MDTFVRDTYAAIAAAVEPQLGYRLERPTPEALVAALRSAEAATSGHLRDLWGCAAANADAAVWIADDTETSRELWAAVLDYVRHAADETGR